MTLTQLPVPLLCTMVMVPLLTGLGLLAQPARVAPSWARRISRGAALVTLLLAGFAATRVHLAGPAERVVDPLAFAWVGQARPLLGIDALGALLLPFYALLALGILFAAPRRELDHGGAAALLVIEGATLGLYVALDLVFIGIFFVLELVPVVVMLRRRMEGQDPTRARATLRVFAAYFIPATLLLATALGWIGIRAAHAGLAAPLHVPDLAQARDAYSPATASWIVGLLVFAILIRKGVFPLHSWLPALFTEGPLATGLLLGSAHVGAYLLLRLAIPLFPGAARGALSAVAYLGLVTAVYASVVGLVQQELRRTVAFVSLSQSALVLVGLECSNLEGITGSLGVWLAASLAIAGMGLCIAALEARVGPLDLRKFHGLSTQAPMLALFYLLHGLAAVGIAGSFEFISEDLLMHGVLGAHPEAGVAVIVATSFNGITVLRSFSRAFLGTTPRRPLLQDLLRREYLALVVFLLAVAWAGSLPATILQRQITVAQQLLP